MAGKTGWNLEEGYKAGRELPTAQSRLILILEAGGVRESGRTHSLRVNAVVGEGVGMCLLGLGLVFFCTDRLTLTPRAWT